ncbi:MAG TPA: response regulator [Pirellulales bacterium]|nr:response regulator [Pirellulales bacterium]
MPNRLNVLVADEDQSGGEAAALIQRWGHQATWTHDGLSAVEAASSLRPHLAFVGLALPKLNGFGVVERVRQLPGLSEARLVALVDAANAIPLPEFKRAGFSDRLLKPIAPIALLDALIKTRDSIASSAEKVRLSAEQAVRSRNRNAESRRGLEDSKKLIEISRQSIGRPLPPIEPAAPLAGLQLLVESNRLGVEPLRVALEVLAGRADILSAEDRATYAHLRNHYLQPACKLCRYRIPREEVVDSWSNGGYCHLCADALE